MARTTKDQAFKRAMGLAQHWANRLNETQWLYCIPGSGWHFFSTKQEQIGWNYWEVKPNPKAEPVWMIGNDSPCWMKPGIYHFAYREKNGKTEYLLTPTGKIKTWKTREAAEKAVKKLSGV